MHFYQLTGTQLRRLCLKGVVKPEDYLMYKRLLRSKRLKCTQTFNLDHLSPDDCLHFLRFSHAEIIRLYKALKIPEMCKTVKGDKFPGIL